MSEPHIHVSTGFGGGISVNLRADSPAELEQLVAAAASSPTLARLMQQTGITITGSVTPDEAQALANIQQTFPQSTVGQPLPQPTPGVVAAQPAAAPAAPPTLVHPGNCAHGIPYVYKDIPARGKPWRRWECGLPFKAGDKAHNDSRCKPINLEN